LAVELGSAGIRVIYVKVGPFPETRGPRQAVRLISQAMGMAPELLGQAVVQASLLTRTCDNRVRKREPLVEARIGARAPFAFAH
jgi:hypothetical protein